jgi:hypothetical protein
MFGLARSARRSAIRSVGRQAAVVCRAQGLSSLTADLGTQQGKEWATARANAQALRIDTKASPKDYLHNGTCCNVISSVALSATGPPHLSVRCHQGKVL